jgi:hypothetical protein
MARHEHWLPQLIATAGKYDKAAVSGPCPIQKLIDYAVNGRIHAEINPHRSEDNGTKSFRFSYSDPPLQQMPSRDEEIAPLIRGLFLPEEGEFWAKPDASQQEFRFVVHYANQHRLRKAAEAVTRYHDDPNTDFHELAATITSLPRKDAKGTNFAKIYGAGVDKFAQMVGKPVAEARDIYERYDRELPFLKLLGEFYTNQAHRQGYITLYDGARRHFDRWAPGGGKWKKKAGPCELEEARRRLEDPTHPWYGRKQLHRADTRTALNALIQGSAARHTKLWMRAVWREGIVPLLQMHDALECSVSSREQAELVARLGEEAVQLDVPMRVDLKFGYSWGDAKHSWEELQEQSAANPNVSKSAAAPRISESAGPTLPPWEESRATRKILCPFHDDHNPSLQIYSDGHYHCFSCGAHGDVEDLPELPSACSTSTSPQVIADPQKLQRGLKLWQAANPIAGTLAERYLVGVRKLNLAVVSDLDAVLRFHPRCPFNGAEHPCVIALFRDAVTDEAAGIHRIALTTHAEKIGRMMLGSWDNPRAIKLKPLTTRLIIGEGIETTMAGGGFAPHPSALWALGAANAVAKFPVIPGVTELAILVDRDPNNIGMDAARACATRWSTANRKVILQVPHRIGTDFNDLVKESVS